MGKIDLSINKVGLAHNIQKAKENNVIIPTIAQMQNPDLIPEKIKAKLSHTGLWDVDPVNLFRISWHNEAKESGGLFQAVPNYVEIPSKLSGVPCRIVAMSGKWFPTGCHKVGASFGCLAPRLVTGQFDATYHHAVWPSTGNYCRGGAFNSKLLACDSVAILDGGVVVEQGEVREIFANPKTAAARRLVAPNGGSAARDLSSFAPDDHVVRVTFNGSSAAKPLVASLAAETGILVSVLSADTRDLSGQCYGSMLLKLPKDVQQAKQAAAYMRGQPGVTVEEVTGE